MAIPAVYAVQTTTTTGTGTLTLIAPASNLRSFNSAVGSSSIVVTYRIDYSGGHEFGIGTYDGTSPGTLTRTTILASSNGGSAVSLPAGTATVFLAPLEGGRGRTVYSGSGSAAAIWAGGEVVWTGSSDNTLTLLGTSTFPEGLATILFRSQATNGAILTIATTGGETINGATQLKLGFGDWAEITKRGSAWEAHGSARLRTTFTGSGTWRKNALTSFVRVRGYGGGGGGGAGVVVAGSTACSGGAGGGGGGAFDAMFSAADLSATETVTVGAGGTGGTTSGGSGTAGGTTIFGAYVAARAYGGGGGAGGQSGGASGGGAGGMIIGAGSSGSAGTGGAAFSAAGSAGGSGAGTSANVGIGVGIGGAGCASGGVGLNAGTPLEAGQGGASGGGITVGNAAQNGGGQSWASTIYSTAGTAPGGNATALPARAAGQKVAYGGAGGASAITANGGSGAAGQSGGGGGGGGGSTQTGYTQGSGGDGGAGLVVVEEW